MNPFRILLFKDLLILKNNIVLTLRKPWRWIFAVVFIGFLIYQRLRAYTGEAISYSADTDFPEISEKNLEAAVVLFSSIVGIISLMVIVFVLTRATKRNTTFFINADTHFLFPGPFDPRLILIYQLIKSLLPAILSSLVLVLYLFLFLTPENFPVSFRRMGHLAIPLALFIFSIRPIQFLIFTIAAGGSAGRTVRQVKALRNLFIASAVIAIGINLKNEGILEILKATFLEGTFQYIPFVGWFQSALVKAFTGQIMSWELIFLAVSVALLPVGVYRLADQYYEDVLASTEMRTRAEQMRSGETQLNDEVEYSWTLKSGKIRDHGDFGKGAIALFWKNYVMAYRQTGIPYLDLTAFLSGITGVVFAVLILLKSFDRDGFSMLVTVSMVLMGLLSFSAGHMRVKIGDLTRPLFAMIPDHPGRKLFFLLLLDMIQVAVYAVTFFMPVTLAYGSHWELIPLSGVLLVVLYLMGFLFQLNVRLSVTSWLDRYLFLPLGYMALMLFCLIPSVFICMAAFGFFKSFGAVLITLVIFFGVFVAFLYSFVLEKIDQLEY